MLKTSRLLLVWFILFGARELAASYRIEFVPQYRGQSVPGAEVCFFAASEEADPIARFLVSADVRCFAADSVIEIPVGRWVVFARHESGLVSSNSGTIYNPPPGPSRDVFSKTIIGMKPAGTIDVSRLRQLSGPDDWLALYITNTGTDLLPMLMPVAKDASTVLIPAGMPIVALRMRAGVIRDVSQPLSVEAGHRLVPEHWLTNDRDRTVITWITLPKEDRKVADYWAKLEAPNASLITSDGRRLAPLLALRPGFGSDNALLIFRNAPTTRARVEVTGQHWTSAKLDVDESGPATIQTTQGVQVRPAATVTAHWHNLLTENERDCLNKNGQEKQTTLARLLTCSGLRADTSIDRVPMDQCHVAADGARDGSEAAAHFSGILPGVYLLMIKVPGLIAQRQVVSVDVADDAKVDVDLRPFRFFGRVTLGGLPLKAWLEFRTGGAATDATGQYYALLPQPPKAFPVRIRNCGDGRLISTVLPSVAIAENQPYDIDIPQNHLGVRVVGDGDVTIPDADIQVGAFASHDSEEGEFVGDRLLTNKDGEATVDNLPSDRELIVCAQKVHYQRSCSDRFVLPADDKKTVTVHLRPAGWHAGRVLVNAPLRWGRIYFVHGDGSLSEWQPLGEDGRFSYQFEHRAPEYAVVASSAPLIVFPLSDGIPDELRVVAPPVAIGDLTVSIGERNVQRDARIGLVINGRYIPEVAYAMHQSGRGLQPNIYGKGPLRIPEIPVGFQIRVILGPPPEQSFSELPSGADVFAIPGYVAHYPTKSPDNSGMIVF